MIELSLQPMSRGVMWANSTRDWDVEKGVKVAAALREAISMLESDGHHRVKVLLRHSLGKGPGNGRGWDELFRGALQVVVIHVAGHPFLGRSEGNTVFSHNIGTSGRSPI